MSRRPRREDYTVGWICALPVELTAAQEMLDEEHEDIERDSDDENLYSLGSVAGHNVVIVCLPAGRIGNNPAAAVGTQMRATFKGIRFGLMVGIGGGVPSPERDIRLGDVVVSQPNQTFGGVVQYDVGKTTPSGFKRTGSLNSPPQILLSAVSKVQANKPRGKSKLSEHVSKLDCIPEFQRDKAGPDVLFEAAYDHEGGQACELCNTDRQEARHPREREEVGVHYGTIASGNQVMRDGRTRDRLSSELGGVLCFEMEAAGLMNNFPCLVIRGICDYADSHKNKKWQPYAAGTAAAYAKELLSVIPPTAKTRPVENTRQEEKEDKECVRHLRLTDPCDDKKRIEETKGGLLEDAYRWILENSDFQRWRNDQHSRLLWIKGDPGKGKTMLLCGIINELKKSTVKTALMSYFFCQATDSRINNATAVLRGLIYMLVGQQPSLVSHIRKRYEQAGKDLFEDANAWVALSEILSNVLQDPSMNTTYLIIDALDECVVDLPKLLAFIIHVSSSSTRVKWLLSSRNEPDIEKKLRSSDEQTRLRLELKENAEQVSRAVDVYIDDKLSRLEPVQDDALLRDQIRDILRRKADGTFLWVALVAQELENAESWDVLDVVKEVPKGLYDLYGRMVDQIQRLPRRDPEFCRLILSTAIVAYRPLQLAEMGVLSGLPIQILRSAKDVEKIVAKCGSFLTVRDDRVYLIHQSAKDYLSDSASAILFLSGTARIHHGIFTQSLELMSARLRRDMYDLVSPGFPIDEVKPPRPNPIDPARYSCVYWVDHLCDSVSGEGTTQAELQDGGAVYTFLKGKYLYWLEALSLLRSMSEGVIAMEKLGILLGYAGERRLTHLIQDGYQFILSHKWVIENAPLQAYGSALVFSPARSLVRELFKAEEPSWITTKPPMESGWNACRQTLHGHGRSATSVAFSDDGLRLASGSNDDTIKIWNAATGQCLRTLEGHRDQVNSITFSGNGLRLASGSKDNTVKIWDVATGQCLQTLEGHRDRTNLWTMESYEISSVAFSNDGQRLASALNDKTVRIWDATTGQCLQMLEGHNDSATSVAFLNDGQRLVSASHNGTVRIWNIATGQCLQTLEANGDSCGSVALSSDGQRLASSWHSTFTIWNTVTGQCLQTLEDQHTGSCAYWAGSVAFAFSGDGQRLASASDDRIVKIWDAATGQCLQTLEGHSDSVRWVAFSSDGLRLASASDDMTVKIWDNTTGQYLQKLERHRCSVSEVAFLNDGKRLVSVSFDETIKIWDTATGQCVQTLEGGHLDSVRLVALSSDGQRLAWASDRAVRIWNTATGQCLQVLEGYFGSVTSFAFSGDGHHFASASGERLAWASDDNTVKIWDAATGQCLQTLEGHRYWISSVAFSGDGQRLASASDDKTVKIWDTGTGQCLQTLETYIGWVQSAVFSRDGRLALALRETVRIWDTATGQCLQTFNANFGYSVRSVAYSEDGQCLVSALYCGTVKIWEAATSQCLQTLNHCGVNLVVFSSDGQRLASASDDKTIRIWDTVTGRCLQTLEGHRDLVSSAAFSGDGRRCISYLQGGIVRIWNTDTGQFLLEGPLTSVSSVVFSSDCQRLASALDDGTVKIWDATTGQCLQTLEGHCDRVKQITFSGDCQRLVLASDDKNIRIWDTTTGQRLQALEACLGWVNCVAFSNDGQRLASASDDGTVRIRDTATGQFLQTLKGHHNSVSSVAFSGDDQRLVSVSWGETVRTWNTATGQCLQTLEGHHASVRSVVLSSDGQRLASASDDGTVKIWDAATGQCLQTLEGHRNQVKSITFSSDDQRLISCSDDKTVRIWDTATGQCLHIINVGFQATNLEAAHVVSVVGATVGGCALEQQYPDQYGYGLNPDGSWIIHNGQNVLWLPTEYRARCSAVLGWTVCIGCTSGRVLIFSFSQDIKP